MENSVEKVLNGKRGLVIDDDPTLLKLVSKYLTRQGCEVTTALNVKTALNIISDKDFDFVICDIYMEGLGGAYFYQIVKEKHPSLINQIIFSTGDMLSDSTKTFIKSVTNPCIEKPFSFDELKELIIKKIFTSDK